MKKKKYGICVMLFLVFMLVFAGCGSESNVKQNTTTSVGETISVEQQFIAVIQEIDPKAQTIILRNVDTKEEQLFRYNGGTQVYSKNKVAILMSQLVCGEIVEVSYETNRSMLKRVQVSKDAWEYKRIKASNLNRGANFIEITGRKYKYDSGISVFCQDERKMLMEINERDEVTVKGIGSLVYSVIITQGHGYLRLGGHDAFLGGTIEVDQNIFLKVESNMLITVSEGEHTVVLRNGQMQAVENIVVNNGQEYFLDLSEHRVPEETQGKLKFVINPSDAVLYINGKVRNYSRLVSLPYGNYTVTVTAEGYEDYTGILRVQQSSEAYEVISIDLVPSLEATVTQAPKATEEPDDSNQESNATATPEATPKGEQSITINTPEGASVYINGVYKGVAPVTFAKVTGEITITLSMTGYETKSYTITVEDDSEDVEYSFANLIKK